MIYQHQSESYAWLYYVPGIIASVASAVNLIWTKMQDSILKRQDRVLESVKRTGESTHMLSNSAMSQQLLINVETLQALAVVLRRVAATGGKSDVAAADAIDVRVKAAMKRYEEHLRKQAKLDASSIRSDET